MNFDPEQMKLMDVEHKAWLAFVEQFRKALPDEDLNDSKWDAMVRSIEAWGETLVALRMHQTPEERERALTEKLAAAEAATGIGHV